MEVLLGVLMLVLIVVMLLRVTRAHARQEREALSALGGMVRERQARKKEELS